MNEGLANRVLSPREEASPAEGALLASIAQKLSKCLDGCAILLDIDGTLLPTSSTTISQRNRRALCEAQAAGIHIVIATGRRQQFAEPVLAQVGLSSRTVMISSNGSVIRYFDGELIQRNLLSVTTARALCAALRST